MAIAMAMANSMSMAISNSMANSMSMSIANFKYFDCH